VALLDCAQVLLTRVNLGCMKILKSRFRSAEMGKNCNDYVSSYGEVLYLDLLNNILNVHSFCCINSITLK
jgi:hypothetical protein